MFVTPSSAQSPNRGVFLVTDQPADPISKDPECQNAGGPDQDKPTQALDGIRFNLSVNGRHCCASLCLEIPSKRSLYRPELAG